MPQLLLGDHFFFAYKGPAYIIGLIYIQQNCKFIRIKKYVNHIGTYFREEGIIANA